MEAKAASRPIRLRRRFRWGEHPFAEVAFGVTGFLAAVSWLTAAVLVWMLVAARNGPENMTGLAVAVVMPPVLVAAFGFTAMASSVWHRYWGERISLVVSIGAALAAVLAPCIWMAVVGLPLHGHGKVGECMAGHPVLMSGVDLTGRARLR
jgi:hypothetical protein